MAFDEAEVRNLAKLAHLALSEAEIRETGAHLERLLSYIEQLLAVDVTGAAEVVHAGGAAPPLRPDVARPGLPRPVIMAGAPAADAGLFAVPRVIARDPGQDAADEPEDALPGEAAP